MITHKRIRFRGAERGDIPLFTRWMNDPEVIANTWSCITLCRMANEENWFERMIQRPAGCSRSW